MPLGHDEGAHEGVRRPAEPLGEVQPSRDLDAIDRGSLRRDLDAIARQADEDLDHVGAVSEQRLQAPATKGDQLAPLRHVGAEIDEHGAGIRQAALDLPVDAEPIALGDGIEGKKERDRDQGGFDQEGTPWCGSGRDRR